VFRPDGTPAETFRREPAGAFTTDMCVDAAGNVYVVAADMTTHLCIEKYSPEGEYLMSFSDTFDAGTDRNPMYTQPWAGGAIGPAPDGTLLFTQRAPHEIRRFSRDGDLLAVVHRDGSNVAEPPDPQVEGESMTFRLIPMSTAIVSLANDRFLNQTINPGNEESAMKVTLELYDGGGRLLAESTFAGTQFIHCRDRRGRLYASQRSEYPRLVRYHLRYGDEPAEHAAGP
jgi:hypothetical protein